MLVVATIASPTSLSVGIACCYLFFVASLNVVVVLCLFLLYFIVIITLLTSLSFRADNLMSVKLSQFSPSNRDLRLLHALSCEP